MNDLSLSTTSIHPGITHWQKKTYSKGKLVAGPPDSVSSIICVDIQYPCRYSVSVLVQAMWVFTEMVIYLVSFELISNQMF